MATARPPARPARGAVLPVGYYGDVRGPGDADLDQCGADCQGLYPGGDQLPNGTEAREVVFGNGTDPELGPGPGSRSGPKNSGANDRSVAGSLLATVILVGFQVVVL